MAEKIEPDLVRFKEISGLICVRINVDLDCTVFNSVLKSFPMTFSLSNIRGPFYQCILINSIFYSSYFAMPTFLKLLICLFCTFLE